MLMLVDTLTNTVISGIYNSVTGANKARVAAIQHAIMDDVRNNLLNRDTGASWVYSTVNNRKFRGTDHEISALNERISYHENRIVVKKVKTIIFE